MFGPGKLLIGGGKKIKVVSAVSGVLAGSGSTISFAPTTGRVGQIQIVAIANNSGRSITPPAGWTELLDYPGYDYLNKSIALYYRSITNDDSGNQVFTFGASASSRAYISVFVANALYDTIGTFSVNVGTSQTVSGVTVNKGMLFYLGVCDTATWASPPAGMDLVKKEESGTLRLALFQQKISAGATGTRTATLSTSAGACAGLFSLKGK